MNRRFFLNWKTETGIRIGTSLEALERINGGPFQLSGFDWDPGGIVQRRPEDKLPRDLSVTLRSTKDVPEAEKKMAVVVSSLVISWPDGR